MWLSILGYSGISATLFVILVVCVSAVLYRGRRKERYSPLNHFISELGELGVSRGARLFNTALVIGGLLLLPFIVGLGIALNHLIGWLGMLAGIISGLALSAVGIFPMNNLEAHSKAAMTFFRAGLAMIVLFGLAILLQPAESRAIPPWANFISLLATLSYASFILLSHPKDTTQNELDTLDPANEKERPVFWLLPALEWAVFFSTVMWLFSMALLVNSV